MRSIYPKGFFGTVGYIRSDFPVFERSVLQSTWIPWSLSTHLNAKSRKRRCVCAFVFLPVRILSRHRVHARRANWKCWKANCQLLCRFHPGLTTASNWKCRSSSRTVCAAKQDYKIHFKRSIYIRTYTGRLYYIQRHRICYERGRYLSKI